MMARSRVYRPEISCSECGSHWMRKNGFTNGRQAYRCGDCQRGYAPGVAIYLECGSPSAVGCLRGYSPPAVLGWVKKGGAAAVNWLRERSTQRMEGAAWPQPAAVVAGAEMWTYRGARRVKSGQAGGFGRR